MPRSPAFELRPLALSFLLFAFATTAAELSVGSAPGCDFDDLDDAIAAASPGDVLRLTSETFSDVITIDRSLTLVGGHAACGDASPSGFDRSELVNPLFGSTSLIEVTGTGTTVTLARLNVSGARSDDPGGGIHVGQRTMVTLDAVSLTDNQAPSGGGIYIDKFATVRSAATLSIVVDGNSATAGPGGGIYVGSGAVLDFATQAPAILQITNNEASSSGGGVFVTGPEAVALTNATIEGNHSDSLGGGLAAGPAPRDQSIVLQACSISENTARGGAGVQLQAAGDGIQELRLEACEVRANEAIDHGAGIAANGWSVVLEDTAVVDNVAGQDGGGIHTFDTTMELRETAPGMTSIAGNMARRGGGLFLTGATILFTQPAVSVPRGKGVTRMAISNNEALWGGGLFLQSQATANLDGHLSVTANVVEEDGGGVYASGSNVLLRGAAEAEAGLVMERNTAAGNGGAIYVTGGAVDLTGARIGDEARANTAANGGGAFAVAGASVTLLNTQVSGNEATFNGGGLYVGDAVVLDVASRHPGEPGEHACNAAALPINRYCSGLDLNAAGNAGGAIYATFNAAAALDRVALQDNLAPAGAAIHLAMGGTLSADAILVVGHDQAIDIQPDAALAVNHATIAGNSGGGIRLANDVTASLEMRNSILWDNGVGLDTGASASVTTDCNLSQSGALTGDLVVDPLFAKSLRGAWRPGFASPAEDLCQPLGGRDLDGVERPQGPASDAGAFEALVERPAFLFGDGFEVD